MEKREWDFFKLLTSYDVTLLEVGMKNTVFTILGNWRDEEGKDQSEMMKTKNEGLVQGERAIVITNIYKPSWSRIILATWVMRELTTN